MMSVGSISVALLNVLLFLFSISFAPVSTQCLLLADLIPSSVAFALLVL